MPARPTIPSCAIPLLAALLSLARAAAAAETAPLAASQMQDYLVQSVCLDAEGKPTPQMPFDPACLRLRPLQEDDPIPWRKHDWGGIGGPSAGWQASGIIASMKSG